MSTFNAQSSEIHDTTADASTSPAGSGDEQTTRKTPGTHGPKASPNNPAPDAKIVRDETDAGGPLVVETSTPETRRETT